MKTIIRIGDVIEGPEAKLAKKFSSFGIRAFVEGYGNIREEHPEAVLIVEEDQKKLPVYITVGPNPPELLAGDRRVYAVFSPPDSQEPIATFSADSLAKHWIENRPEDYQDEYVIRRIDSTDNLGVQASVAIMIRRNESELLFCRLKKSKLWTFPEGKLEVGESVEWAARRAVKNLVGLRIGEVKIPGLVPYINTFVEQAAQHFLTVVLVTDTFEGEPKIMDPDGAFEHCEWFPATDPPGPLFPTVQGINRILSTQRPDDLVDLTKKAPKPKSPQEIPSPTVVEEREVVIEDAATKLPEPTLVEAQKRADDLINAMKAQPPVLITGTPRSGTVYATSVLRAAFAKHETDVAHEDMGSIVTVSWCHINPDLDRKFWNEAVGRYTGRYTYDCPEWTAIAHQTRDPLKVIASMPTIPFEENGGWVLTQSALRTQQAIFDHLGDSDPTWPEDLTSIAAYALFVLRWNRYIESFTSFRYHVEDLHGGEGSVWPTLLDHLKLPQVPFPDGPFKSNAREHDVVTWDDVKKHAPDYYEPLRIMAHEYGYLD